jgi:hypothetical protein
MPDHVKIILGSEIACAGAEFDLLVMAEGRRFGFEFKYADAPGLSRSMLVAGNPMEISLRFKVKTCSLRGGPIFCCKPLKQEVAECRQGW